MTAKWEELGTLGVIAEAHRSMVARIIDEGSFEATLDLICAEAAQRAGLNSAKPTIKQRRYRELGPTLSAALDAATMWRV